MDNQVLAKIIFKNQLASQEQIKAVWSEITPSEDIAKVLIRHGILDSGLYTKIIDVAKKRMAKATTQASPAQAQAPRPTAPQAPVPPKAEAKPFSNEPTDYKEPELKPYVKAATPVSQPKPEPVQPQSEIGLESNTVFGAQLVEGLDSTAPLDFTKVQSNLEIVSVLESTSLGNMGITSTPAEKVETAPQAPSAPEAQAKAKPAVETPQESTPNQSGIPDLPQNFEGRRGDGEAIRVPSHLSGNETLNEMLAFARMQGATDIHISPLNPVLLKQFGALVPCTDRLAQDQIEKMASSSIKEDLFAKFLESGDLETVQAVPGFGRFRVTLMKQQKGWDITARVIPGEVLDFKDAGLPENCLGLTKWAQGLVLVTGPAGSGKTRTLSILVNEVNKNRKDHIISIENPIEVVYPEGNCQITQREVGISTQSQANALRAALRQDPDIIVVSELRDLESMELAISAAETGHLVFATMNTTNAMRTLSRLIDSFPPEEQDIIRAMVSESLRGVVSQQLIPNKEGTALETAFELLLTTLPIANLIRKNEMHQLESAMITGRSQGMITLDDSLKTLVEAGKIEAKEAYYRAVNPKNFERYL